MNRDEFKTLMEAYANKTSRIRVYEKGDFAAVESSILDPKIPEYIGSVVKKIDAEIDEFCNKDETFLIYDFQLIDNSQYFYCSLCAVVKPLSELAETDKNVGRRIQVVIVGSTGELINTSECMIRMGIGSEEDVLSRKTYGYAYQSDTQNKLELDLKIKMRKIKNEFALILKNKDLYEVAASVNRFMSVTYGSGCKSRSAAGTDSKRIVSAKYN